MHRCARAGCEGSTRHGWSCDCLQMAASFGYAALAKCWGLTSREDNMGQGHLTGSVKMGHCL